MKIKILLINLIGLVFIFSSSQVYSVDQEKLEAKQILQSSELSLKKLIANDDLKKFKKFLKDARAILIFPEVYEGGFIFGAKGGNGLLIIRRGNNKFSGPFFFFRLGTRLLFLLAGSLKPILKTFKMLTHIFMKCTSLERPLVPN